MQSLPSTWLLFLSDENERVNKERKSKKKERVRSEIN